MQEGIVDPFGQRRQARQRLADRLAQDVVLVRPAVSG